MQRFGPREAFGVRRKGSADYHGDTDMTLTEIGTTEREIASLRAQAAQQLAKYDAAAAERAKALAVEMRFFDQNDVQAAEMQMRDAQRKRDTFLARAEALQATLPSDGERAQLLAEAQARRERQEGTQAEFTRALQELLQACKGLLPLCNAVTAARTADGRELRADDRDANYVRLVGLLLQQLPYGHPMPVLLHELRAAYEVRQLVRA